MPFIRDWQFNFHATTTATTVTCALPQYAQNDLLLAICSITLTILSILPTSLRCSRVAGSGDRHISFLQDAVRSLHPRIMW